MYIRTAACISPWMLPDEEAWPAAAPECPGNRFRVKEPDYKPYINPVQIRRMSRALKFGFSSAIHCLHHAALLPEAITIGTGKGCLSDTEGFLHSIQTYHETALQATPFIHSTYNQLNGMISQSRKINSYNMTYVHRSLSFESALLDIQLGFQDGSWKTALCGCFDEVTEEHFEVMKSWGHWKKESCRPDQLLHSVTDGSVAGEGAAFFFLQSHADSSTPFEIDVLATMEGPDASFEFIQQHRSLFDSCDLLLTGENGDRRREARYRFIRQPFLQKPCIGFKPLCGEYDTATGFALWFSTRLLAANHIPDYLFHPLHPVRTQGPVNSVLIYNDTGMQQSLLRIRKIG